jgi:hypothetical protein
VTSTNGDDGTAGHNPAVSGSRGGSRGVPERDRLLLDLGQELRAMRVELGEAASKFDVVVRDVSEVIGPDVADLRVQVATLRGEMDVLLDQSGDQEAEDERPLDWHDLSAEQAAQAWEELGKWINTTLGYWFGVTRGQLPDCWPLHRPAVRQLWALYLVYGAAHEGPRAAPVNVIEWNTRWLDTVLGKVRDAIPDTMCRPLAGKPGSHLVPKQEHERQVADEAARIAAAGGVRERVDAGVAARRADAAEAERSKYSIPEFANPAGPATSPPPALPGWSGVAAEEEVIDTKYWGQFFASARDQDLAWRRERDASLAAETADF